PRDSRARLPGEARWHRGPDRAAVPFPARLLRGLRHHPFAGMGSLQKWYCRSIPMVLGWLVTTRIREGIVYANPAVLMPSWARVSLTLSTNTKQDSFEPTSPARRLTRSYDGSVP